MSQSLHVRTGSTWELVPFLYVRSGGVWREVQEAFVRDGGVWQKFHQAFIATASPATVTGNRIGEGFASTNTATVAVSGGVGPFTYFWEVVSQSGSVTAGFVDNTNPSTQVSATFTNGGQSVSGVIKCVVTDTTTGVIVDSTTVNFTLVAI